MNEQAAGTVFPVGTRVRYRIVPTCLGIVTDGLLACNGSRWAWVRWDGDDHPDMVQVRNLEVIAPGIAVGARVRYQGVQDVGTVTSTDGKRAMVRWDHGITSDRWISNLVLVDAPPDRAPERVLAPNIVLSPDGVPVILGTAIPTRAIYESWERLYLNGHRRTVESIADDFGACTWEVHEAIGFEAGVRWAKEPAQGEEEREK